MSIFDSNSFRYKRIVVVPSERTIKIVEHIEEIDEHVVFYMSDKTSYGINQLKTLEETLSTFK
jgi:hypothetical protein